MKAGYLAVAAVLFGLLVVIAVGVRDDFVRPFGGDVLVGAWMYCLVRGTTRLRPGLVAAAVLLFALLVEAGQALQLVEVLGLSDYRVARIVLGTTADWMDVVAYAVGAGVSYGCDRRFTGRGRSIRPSP